MKRRQLIIGGIGLSAILILAKLMFAKKQPSVITSYTSNENLPTVRSDWTGTPLDQDGLFINEEFPYNPDFLQALKFLTERNPQREIKKNDPWKIPVIKDNTWVLEASDKIVWLGHASFFIQLSGKRILIDPVFGSLPSRKRHSEMPIDPGKLLNIDYILISHAHYDHCDKDSIKLLSKNNPGAQILTGLKLDTLIGNWTTNKILTAGWYQQYKLDGNLKVTYLPSRHWSNRNLWDANSTLWGGFMIQHEDKTIYYAGDSGHGSHFSEIGKIFPGIDISLIGTGAYAPKWFMKPVHQDPYDAVDAFHATNGKVFVPFHYGTFDLGDEPMGEPEEILSKLEGEGKIQGDLKILKLGEAFSV